MDDAAGQKTKRHDIDWLRIGAVPFYISHQTVIIVLGHYVVRWRLGVWAKFWITES
jgi:hypothetical protein